MLNQRTMLNQSNPNRYLDRVEFSRLREKCIRVSRTCYREVTTRMKTRIRGDSKKFWPYVKSLKKLSDLLSEMYFKEKKGNNYIDIANLFSDRFAEVSSHSCNLRPPGMLNPLNVDTFCSFIIYQENVLKHIQKLENMFSAGPDEISCSLVKQSAKSLVDPLLTFFNKALEFGQFPKE